MPRLIDMSCYIGKSFGRLTVVEVLPPANGRRMAVCRCECGIIKSIRFDGLQNGMVKSCGCWQKEAGAAQGLRNATHGCCRRILPRAPEHAVWNMMIQRCTNPNYRFYYNYGGRGISVCERWRNSFEDFIADMGFKPSSKHSIERKDNHGNYCPENCRWATKKEQGRNKRNNRYLTYNGRTMTISAWAEETGIPGDVIRGRLILGWSHQDAIFTPVRKKGGPIP